MTLRSDFLMAKKGVHIAVDKEVYLALRQLLFTHEVSVQSLYEEFTRLLVQGDSRATKVLDSVIMKKTSSKLQTSTKRRINAGRAKRRVTKAEKQQVAGPQPKQENSSALDHNVLYNLIQENDSDPDEDL